MFVLKLEKAVNLMYLSLDFSLANKTKQYFCFSDEEFSLLSLFHI